MLKCRKKSIPQICFSKKVIHFFERGPSNGPKGLLDYGFSWGGENPFFQKAAKDRKRD